jgi:hypothetical protein
LTDDQVLGRASSRFEMTTIREDGTEMPFPDRPGPRAIALKRPMSFARTWPCWTLECLF